jgi:hypothetical protein
MLRQARLDAPSALHRGIERRGILRSDKDRKDFLDRTGSLPLENVTVGYEWAVFGC